MAASTRYLLKKASHTHVTRVDFGTGADMSYLKHNSNNGTAKRSRSPKKSEKLDTVEDRAADYVESDCRHSRCMEEAVDGLTSVLSTYVSQERNGDNAQPLYSSPSGYPVKVEIEDTSEMAVTLFLEGVAVESIAESLKRIADALTSGKAQSVDPRDDV